MHFSPRRAATGLAALFAATLTLRAQSWVSVYDPAHGGLAGSSSDIATDAAGNIYAAGSSKQSADGTMHAIVLGSGNHGTTWSTLDQYAELGLNYAHNRAITPNLSTGSLLVGGNLNNLLPNGTYEFDTLWFIRERDSSTGIWSTVDDATNLLNDIGQASCADLLVTPSGDIYATGGGSLGMVIRKRAAGAGMFSTVHVDRSGQTTGAGWDLGFHPGNGMFAVGDANGGWVVRRSLTGEPGTWVTVDSFKTTEWSQTSARSIVITASGAVHVAGWGYSSKTRRYHWLVRSSTNGGSTWSLSDTYTYGGGSVSVSAITEDASGNLFVGGQAADSAGQLWWLVRKGVPGTTRVKQGGKWIYVPTIAWSNSDAFQLVPGQAAQVNGLTTDATGAVFASGRAADAAGANQWIVRRLGN